MDKPKKVLKLPAGLVVTDYEWSKAVEEEQLRDEQRRERGQ